MVQGKGTYEAGGEAHGQGMRVLENFASLVLFAGCGKRQWL